MFHDLHIRKCGWPLPVQCSNWRECVAGWNKAGSGCRSVYRHFVLYMVVKRFMGRFGVFLVGFRRFFELRRRFEEKAELDA